MRGLSPDRRQRESGLALRFFSEATRLGGGSPINYGDGNIPVFLVVYRYKQRDANIAVFLVVDRD